MDPEWRSFLPIVSRSSIARSSESSDIALLLAADLRFDEWLERMPETEAQFIQWVESDLVDCPAIASSEASEHWHCPPGAHRSLRCGPLMLPVSLLNPSVDYAMLLSAKTASSVKHVLKGESPHGVCIFPRDRKISVLTLLRDRILSRMKWDVIFIDPKDRNDKTAISSALVM